MAPVNGRRLALGGAIVAVIGFVGLAIGLVVDPARTWLSYLMAFAFAFTISAGGLILLMTGYATNARWMSVVRRATELVVLPMPALAVLFVPLVFGLGALYPWASLGPELSHHELTVLHHRAGYMNVPFFIVRAAIYFAVLIVAGYPLRRWSVRRDNELPRDIVDTESALSRERVLSSALLPLVGLVLTGAAFDWLMSLQPLWYSTIFGIYVFAGGFLAAIACVTIVAARLWRTDNADGTITPHHFHALGRLLFAFTVFWAYSAFFQAMLIRIADKPEEVTFFLQRLGGMWVVFVYVLVLGHFALPFLVLLPRQPKFRPRLMALAGGWLVFVHLVDIYWLVIPSHVQGMFVLSWLDLAALAAVVGTCVAVAAWRQRGVLPMAVRDPFLPAGAVYRSPT